MGVDNEVEDVTAESCCRGSGLALAVGMAAPSSASGAWTGWNPEFLRCTSPQIVSLTTQMNIGLQAHGYLSTANTTVYRYSQWESSWHSSNGNWATSKIRDRDYGNSTWGIFCARQ